MRENARVLLIVLLLMAASAFGQGQIQKASARLAAEAERFFESASRVSGKEVLEHLAPLDEGPSAAAIAAGAEAKWQKMTIESEYGFGVLEGGDMVELRKVLTVNGKPYKSNVESLAAAATSQGDRRKRELLRVFEKVGVSGAATDFGQLLLLFHPNSLPSFELQFAGMQMLGVSQCEVYRYRQIDGPPKMTILSGRDEAPRRVPAAGLVWLDRRSLVPVRVSMMVTDGEGARAIRVEAQVDYRRTGFGFVLPEKISHREWSAGRVVVSNEFTYSDFAEIEKKPQK